MSPSGPKCLAAARSSPRVMEWSPPRASGTTPRRKDRRQPLLDDLVGRLDVAGNDGQVTTIDRGEVVEDRDTLLDVVGAEQPRGLADRRRPEAAPDPVT